MEQQNKTKRPQWRSFSQLQSFAPEHNPSNEPSNILNNFGPNEIAGFNFHKQIETDSWRRAVARVQANPFEL